MNQHYYNKYQKFISSIQSLNRDISLVEIHHIVPLCIGGSNDANNTVRLSLREHYIAHWMLWKVYSGNAKLCFAFYAMCNKNPKIERKGTYFKFDRCISSVVYTTLKIEVRKHLSEQNSGWVYVLDPNTNKYLFKARNKLTKKEKRINIYEWNSVKDDYEIIDTEKYHKLKRLT